MRIPANSEKYAGIGSRSDQTAKPLGLGIRRPRADSRDARGARAPSCSGASGSATGEIELPVPLDAVELAPPRLRPPDELGELLSADPAERARHAMGRAFRDVARGFRGRFDRTPDMVARPRDAEDVRRVLELCADRRLAAIPFGGGTSVVGGVEPRVGHGYRGTVSIDLAALTGIVEIDEVSSSALIRGGTPRPRPRGRRCAPTA